MDNFDPYKIAKNFGYCYKYTCATKDWFCAPGSHMWLLCLNVFLVEMVSVVRFLEGLLRQASSALIVHCPTAQCFVNQNTENEQSFHAEEYSDICGKLKINIVF